MQTSGTVTIHGITYTLGKSSGYNFNVTGTGANKNLTGRASSDGTGGTAVALGNTSYSDIASSYPYYNFKYYNSGASYPISVYHKNGYELGWYPEGVLPYQTYTVSYNANGGSGAPGSQTKTWGTNLTLSSTQPSRTGYTFTKWNTNSGGTGTNYNSGATYSANAGATLYAQWQIITYTIKFDANGGTGAPGNQTKTYGTNLTLSTTKPTRTNYDFLGWSTSKTATTATWGAGGTYTANAAATLYAVWKISTSTLTLGTDNITLSTSSSTNVNAIWKPNDSSFKFRVKAQIPSSVGTARTVWFPSSSTFYTPGHTNQFTQSITFDNQWVGYITTTKSATCTLTLYTYDSSGNSLGSDSKTLTLTLPDGLNPTVDFNNSIVSVYGTAAFSNKITTLDKIQIPWKFNNNQNSPLKEVEAVVQSIKDNITTNEETVKATSGTSGILNTLNTIPNYGTHRITLKATDQRNNVSSSVTQEFYVYRYIDPTILVKYTPDKKLDITGNFAYVGGANSKQILLSVYEGNSNTAAKDINDTDIIDRDITSSASWSPTGDTVYDQILPITFTNGGFDLTSLIDDSVLDTTSYQFVVKAIDSKNSLSPAISRTNSAVPVMTFGAGGTGITVHKPMTFEQGVNSFQVLAQNTGDEGGQIEFQGSGTYTNAMYIDRLQNQFRAIRYDGSNNYIFNQNMAEPYQLSTPARASLGSTSNLDSYVNVYMSVRCDNVLGKPSGTNQYGFCFCSPGIQMYHEWSGATGTSPNRLWLRNYSASGGWTTWQAIPTSGAMYNFVVDWGVTGAWRWRKWNNGDAECWTPEPYLFGNVAITTSYGNGYFTYKEGLSFPSGLFSAQPSVTANTLKTNGLVFASVYGISKTSYNVYVGSLKSESTANIYLSVYAFGKWK